MGGHRDTEVAGDDADEAPESADDPDDPSASPTSPTPTPTTPTGPTGPTTPSSSPDPAAATPPKAPLTVTIDFDDGTADQYQTGCAGRDLYLDLHRHRLDAGKHEGVGNSHR